MYRKLTKLLLVKVIKKERETRKIYYHSTDIFR